ncbi:hypothetical protein GR702_05380 [Novosphingobium sp. FGD1]|uniref:DUF5681 domain-containing protein n=1 Tax=Novosphingobium silvae TaxID=2692619 RepID=A0A7X4GG81_9SPHN|nr:hypothetical protein [Novosphingobium silvae]MYL97202.1 hypothetical protein [Novosphingobium silvae]
MTENNGNLAARDASGRFGPGNSFGGRKLGAKGRFNASAMESLGNLVGPSFTVLKDKLAAGDLKAALFVLTRFLPDSRVIDMPSSEPSAWADAMAAGDITVGEAGKAAQALKVIADTQEVKELRHRLDELEALISAARDAR